MERQREHGMAISMAVASLFDPKVGKEAATAIAKAIKAIDDQQEGLYGLQEFARGETKRRSPQEARKAQENQKDESGLTNKQVSVWKDAAKVDILMAKMTGRPTGAPWSGVTEGNLQMDSSGLNSMAEAVTGAQIVSKMQAMQQRMRTSVRAGPRQSRRKK